MNPAASYSRSHPRVFTREWPLRMASIWQASHPSIKSFFFQWSSDSKALYIYRPDEVPLRVQRLDVATGTMKPIRTLVPADRAGVVSIAPVVTNPQASEFAYSYYQATSILYVISGLR